MGGLVPVKLYGPFMRRPSPKYFTGQIKINGTEKFYNTMHKLLWQWENMCWRPLLLCEELKWSFNYCNFYRLFHFQALLQSHGHLWKAEMGLFHSDGRTWWQWCSRVAPVRGCCSEPRAGKPEEAVGVRSGGDDCRCCWSWGMMPVLGHPPGCRHRQTWGLAHLMWLCCCWGGTSPVRSFILLKMGGQFPPLLEPDGAFGAQQCGSTYSKKPVSRNSCSLFFTGFNICSGL